MTLDDYQKKALVTAIDDGNEMMQRVLGLAGESGEIADIVKKWIRDDKSDMAKLDRQELAAELGDTLWYVAALADHLGFSLEEIAQKNVAKLADRNQRAAIGGSGNNR